MISQTETEPWAIAPGESSYAYSLFVKYLSIPVNERSLRKIAENTDMTKRNIERYSARHNWIARSRQYDAYLLKSTLKFANNA